LGERVSNQTQIRVLVIDHNPIVLEGIALQIRAEADMNVVAITSSAELGIDLYRRSRPDFILIDLDLPKSAGLDAIRRIRAIDPSARMIGLAMYALDRTGLEALAAGATAILAKDQIAERLANLIRTSSAK
jgi:DNA-binding NarL/FixJ family response regulator